MARSASLCTFYLQKTCICQKKVVPLQRKMIEEKVNFSINKDFAERGSRDVSGSV